MKSCREREEGGEESVTSRTKTPQSLSFFWWGMPWGDKTPQLCGAKQRKSTFTWSETLNVRLEQPAFPTPPRLRTVSQSSWPEMNQTILLFRTAGFETGQFRKKGQFRPKTIQTSTGLDAQTSRWDGAHDYSMRKLVIGGFNYIMIRVVMLTFSSGGGGHTPMKVFT